MTDNLKAQSAKIVEKQLDDIKEFREVFRAELEGARSVMQCLRDQIRDKHSFLMGKSFLKSPLQKYQDCIPLPDIEALEKLFEKDYQVCEANVAQEEESYKIIKDNYVKFLVEQQKTLQAFVKEQEKVMYGEDRVVTLDDFKEFKLQPEMVKIDAEHVGNSKVNAIIANSFVLGDAVYTCDAKDAWIDIDFMGNEKNIVGLGFRSGEDQFDKNADTVSV